MRNPKLRSKTIRLCRSQIDPNWIEVREGEFLLQEIEAPFVLRRFPKGFQTQEEAVKWIIQMEWKLAKRRGYWLIAARSYSSCQLAQKLRQARYSESVVQGVVEELQRLGYVKDEDYAGRLIEQEFRRGKGPRWIERKLQSKGLDPSLVRVQITDAMQREKVRELALKFQHLPREKKIKKLAALGFDFASIVF